jgi:hypothetical protein
MTEPPSNPLSVDAAFQLLLKHFDDRRKAINALKALPLWGHQDGRWFEVDMDKYGLFIDTDQTSAAVKMQGGRIGVADFDAIRWAFAAEDVEKVRAETKAVADKKSRRPGRPPDSSPFDWPQLDPILDCWFIYPDSIASDRELEDVRAWYTARFTAEAPSLKTLRARIQHLHKHPLGG